MDKSLKKYLRRVCGWIKNSKRRKDTYKELRSHILDKIDTFLLTGDSPSVACSKVLKEMPNPHWYGYKLRRSQYSFWRRNLFAFSSAFVLMLSFCFVAICLYLVHSHYLPLMDRLSYVDKELLEYFKKDLYLVRDENFFVSKKEKSAHIYLYTTHKDKFSKKNTDQLNLIHQQIRRYAETKDVSVDKNMFLEKIKAIPIETIATDWLENLKFYDSIYGLTPEDQEKLQAVHHQSMIKRISAYASLNGPLYVSDVGNYLYIRAIKMCLKNKCKDAMLELEHAARLIYSSESLIGHMVAIYLIKREKQLIEIFGVNHKVPVSDDVLKAFRRLSWGWRGLQDMVLNGEAVEESLRFYFKPQTGFCAHVAERPLGNLNAFSDFLEDTWLLEHDFSSQIQSERKIMKEWMNLCGLKEYLPLLEKPKYKEAIFAKENYNPWSMTSLSESHSISRIFPNPMRIPYLRQVAGFMLATFALPNYWGPYNELLDEKRKPAKLEN